MSDPASTPTTDLQAFLKKHVRFYNPAEEDDERPAFAEDIKEGKDDPIYNAHSYHTKVPPRTIIPYILHYTRPGDVVLDPFCGSGMTGVAAQMCVKPPTDILEQFPGLKDRGGPRACLLNDLSPAACHIAYNYNTPVDVAALRGEFERIKAAVRDEFDWLYGTEHYEPAIGHYAPEALAHHGDLFSVESSARCKWTLLSRAEVEERLGYPITKLPRDPTWDEADIAKVEQWVCLPATIQYTIWSDVYKCEGFITIEEPTGKISSRGKNAGKPIVQKKRVARGCGSNIIMWDAAVTPDGEILELFKCPSCSCEWKKMQLRRQNSAPVHTNIETYGLKGSKDKPKLFKRRYGRRISRVELTRLSEIAQRPIPYWTPDVLMDKKGPQYQRNALQVRRIEKVTDFWTTRNLWAYASIWSQAPSSNERRLTEVIRFALTGITYYVTKKQPWGSGGGGLSGQLYLSSFPMEKNVLDVFERKMIQLLKGYSAARWIADSQVMIQTCSATSLPLPDHTVDYVFTDPPFGSNIYYSEPNLLWEAWLGRITETKYEAVVHRKSDGGTKRIEDYASLMQQAFCEIYRVLKPGRWATVEFNNSDGALFEVVKLSIRQAGFEIVNMLLLDKEQKTFKQVKGAKGEEDVVDKDVFFNLHKPSGVQRNARSEDNDLEQQVAEVVRHHLSSLPDRIIVEPTKYSDDHRTTATINSMLMNALIPRGVSVERLNLPFIERVCGRYFRKIGQRWYLRGEAVGGANGDLVSEEVAVTDELSAIAWLRQKLQTGPKLIGELKPLWMRATGLLPVALSRSLVLESLLRENFWRDVASNRWREPTPTEREKINDDRALRVLHDADRLIAGTLGRTPASSELCEWIAVLFDTCKELAEGGSAAAAAYPGFDVTEAYRLIVKTNHHLTPEGVDAAAFSAALKQARVAGQRLAAAAESAEAAVPKRARGPEDDKQIVLGF